MRPSGAMSIFGWKEWMTKGSGRIENKVGAVHQTGHLGNLASWPLKCEYTGQLVIKRPHYWEKRTNEMRKQKGFSLIELLIVVAIILIIAAIAIPNLLRARIAANESSAAASLRTLSTSEISYATSFPSIGYPSAISVLGGAAPCTFSSTTACLIDSQLSSGSKSGYTFTAAQAGTADSNGVFPQFVTTAVPVSTSTGVKGFCGTEDNVVRFETPNTGAKAHDACQALAPIGQ